MVDDYKYKVRVRSCGLLIENNRLLLLKHQGLGTAGHLWSPPGGGVEFEESAEKALVREFLEETGLKISVDRFLFIHEHMDKELHALELFFKVSCNAGVLKLGADPETQQQMLVAVDFFTEAALENIPPANKHVMFDHFKSFNALLSLSGYFKFTRKSD